MDIQRLCAAPNCNSHHIIEATFKAFARAMRAALDQLDARADGPFVVRESPHVRASTLTPQVTFYDWNFGRRFPTFVANDTAHHV